MERVLHGLHWKSLLLYIDDIIVIAPDFDTHMSRLEEVLNWLQQAGLKLKPSKCELLQPEVRYLGHIVSATGVATDPEKVVAVKEWPRPQGIKQLQAFLGTVGYYRQYIPGFGTVAQPLHRLTSKEVSISIFHGIQSVVIFFVCYGLFGALQGGMSSLLFTLVSKKFTAS